MRTKKANTNGHERTSRPPRDDLVRAVAERPGIEVRANGDGADGNGMPTLTGHFAVFNEWTEINSFFEGNFLEQIAPGAFRKTFNEQRDAMRVLFQHGMDFNIGDKPLGPIEQLREDDVGAYYEVPMLDTSYNRDELLPGLEANLYGASFRFRVMREEFVEEPDPSDENPKGLPERTIKEAQVLEFGPVTFPAYAGATAGVRSLTDEFLATRMTRERGRAVRLLSFAGQRAVDTEDIDTLAQMLSLATDYIEEQDEADEQPNIDTMKGVVVTLTSLLAGEANEDEPDEPEEPGEETNSTPAPDDSTERDEPAPAADTTSQDSAAPAPAEDEDPEGDAGERSTSTTGPTPLFPPKGRKEPSWRL